MTGRKVAPPEQVVAAERIKAAARVCRAGTAAVLVPAFLCLSLSAHAELVPSHGLVDSRVRSAAYDPNQVYRLHGHVGYQIDIEFEVGEAFVGLGAGDLDGLAYFGQDNHLFIKPRAEKVATNFTVLTNRRHYHFDYSSTPRRAPESDADDVFALQFSYPASAQNTAAEEVAHRIDADLAAGVTGHTRNVDYWFCGSPALRPTAASDDGVHTRLHFSANAELPAIFVRSDDDGETLVNFSVDDGDVVLHRVARRYILRRGKLTGCVVNKGYDGSGLRLNSGTVVPTVERRVQGSTP